MKQRVITAVVGIPVLFALMFFAPLWAFGIAVGFVCALATFELMRMALGKTPKRIYFSAMICSFCMPVICSLEGNFAWGVGFLLLLFFVLSVEQMVSYSGKWRITLEMIAVAMLAGGVIPIMLSTLLRIGQIPGVGRVRMALPFFIAFSTDVGALFAGLKFGKHKLAPHISPKKTLEGSVGGLISAVVVSLLYGLVLLWRGYGVDLLSLALFTVVGSLVAQLGDLTFSAFKRQYGIKDYGNILPGHGGALDRFDSMIYLAPLTEVWFFALPAIFLK